MRHAQVIAHLVAAALALLSIPGDATGQAAASVDLAEGITVADRPFLGWAVTGLRPGKAGIPLVQHDGVTDIALGAGLDAFDDFWRVLRLDPVTGKYRDRFISPAVSCGVFCGLREMRAGDVTGDDSEELVIARYDGAVSIYDARAWVEIRSFPTGMDELEGLALADANRDGLQDILLSTTSELRAYTADGTFLFKMPGPGGKLLAGSFDADPGPEVITSGGQVIDVATRTVQWSSGIFGPELAAADIDGDGMQEVVLGPSFDKINALDVDQQSVKWTLASADAASIALGDIGTPGDIELVVLEEQGGELHVYDALTLAPDSTTAFIDCSGERVTVGDTDGDGLSEIVWTTGGICYGANRIFVTDGQSLLNKWIGQDSVGPVLGPAVGDVDGDGLSEVVYASTGSYGREWGPRVFIATLPAFHEHTNVMPAGGFGSEIHDVRLYDVDGDGRDEIIAAGHESSFGRWWIWDVLGPDTLALKTINMAPPSGVAFYATRVADVDGDGDLELLAAAGGTSSSNESNAVHVYDLVTGHEDWATAGVGSTFDHLVDVVVRNLDDDPAPEVVTALKDGEAFIFDGVTHALEATIPGDFRSFGVFKDLLVLGDAAGQLTVYSHDGAGYVQVVDQPLSADPLDGITITSDARLYVGSGGRLFRFDDVFMPPTWTSQDFGPVFGVRTSLLNLTYQKQALTVGTGSIVGLPDP